MKAAIFDMDGTLVDSMETWERVCVYPLEKYGVPCPDNLLKIITPLNLEETAEYYVSLGLDLPAEQLYNILKDGILNEYKYHIPSKAGALEYLQQLKSQGVKMCMLTAAAREYAIPCVERLGFMEYFEFFMSCDDVGISKTDPAIFKLTADKLGVPIGDVAVFDDNLDALKSAASAGAVVYGVYDTTSQDDAEEIKQICHKYVISFKDLLKKS